MPLAIYENHTKYAMTTLGMVHWSPLHHVILRIKFRELPQCPHLKSLRRILAKMSRLRGALPYITLHLPCCQYTYIYIKYSLVHLAQNPKKMVPLCHVVSWIKSRYFPLVPRLKTSGVARVAQKVPRIN